MTLNPSICYQMILFVTDYLVSIANTHDPVGEGHGTAIISVPGLSIDHPVK